MTEGVNAGWGAPPASAEATVEGPVGGAWGAAPIAEVAELPKFEVLYPGQPDTEDPEAFRLRRNAEIDRWLASRGTLTNAKTDEMDWRGKVSSTLFPVPTKGTQRYDLGGGYKVKLVHTLSYSLGDKDKVDEAQVKVSIRAQVEDLEARVAAMGEAHRVLFEQLVTWKPEISGSQYEKLNGNDPIHVAVRSAIDELLTIKPGSPQLDFEEPKEPK